MAHFFPLDVSKRSVSLLANTCIVALPKKRTRVKQAVDVSYLKGGGSGYSNRCGLLLLYSIVFRPTLEATRPPIQWNWGGRGVK
jgi:hypothetical protein